MIPLRDRLPTRRFPAVTILLIAINVVVFAFQMLVLAGHAAGQRFFTS